MTSYPYEKLPSESEKAFASFVVYRDLPAKERSVPAAYRQKTGKVTAKQATGTWNEWAKKYEWRARAFAWDAQQDRARTEATTKAVAKVAANVAEQREITAQRILEEEARIAFSRITDVIQWQNEDGIVDSDKLPDDVAATIESVEWGYDSESGQKYIRKVKFHGKQPALTKLGENQKLWGSKDDPAQSERSNFFAIFLEAAKSGEIEREMIRRGLLPEPTLTPIERERQRLGLLPPDQAEPIEVESVRKA